MGDTKDIEIAGGAAVGSIGTILGANVSAITGVTAASHFGAALVGLAATPLLPVIAIGATVYAIARLVEESDK